MVYYRCCVLVSSAFIIASFHDYGTIPNLPNSCPKTCSGSSKGYNSSKDRYIDVVARQNRRSTSTRVTSTVAVAIDGFEFALQPDEKRGTRHTQLPREHYRTSCIPRQKNHGLGRILLGYRIDLHICRFDSVTVIRYLYEVPDSIVKMYSAAVYLSFVLMDDNACPQRAAIVNDFLESEGIVRMEWPA
ncbi:uncharacterized protein TNCV_549451 [Trichonephila clavipes]|nr:uncharacterized protein TNCV_549451 [Trichonephila clavipes]